MKFNGSKKQQEWAEKILIYASLSDEQIDNLLKWAGSTMYAQGIMDATIIIDNRNNLAAYADSLGRFYALSDEKKRAVAIDAVNAVRDCIRYLRNELREQRRNY